MSKNIVLLLDGSSNEIAADRTNVLRLFGTLEHSERQVVWYDPGVGTFGADESWSSIGHKTLEVWGLLTGWGLDHNVKEAYRFLVEHYDQGPAQDGRHPDRDRIYLFGFSRGAYTARVLAGFIHAFGLMSPIHLNLLDYAYRTYKDISLSPKNGADMGRRGAEPLDPFATMRLYERTLQNDRPPIKLLGLFDTVASVIEKGNGRIQFRTHPFTDSNPSVEWVRHAVSIDERRTVFRPELWTPGQDYRGNPFAPPQGPQNVKEVWFAGAHGDVGGGYPEAESGQIKIALDWMIRETEPAGLHYRNATIRRIVLGQSGDGYVALDPLAKIHDTMTRPWRLLEAIPRRVPKSSFRKNGKEGGVYIPCVDPRLIPEGALLHDTVKTRLEAGSYKPPNLPVEYQYVP
ncbi:T6SS phospholipase effector Tle1-like catalytic domain-containing protein [Rhizobium halophytocola]|uniref:Uncharacterized protein (DUF2235 family) n=1 Tax=Rhizobium halophytocola TaxID=735519 RepID=A0ABS4E3Z2_9HYPH|nr:DUF2235 domain-containing protein [Rhizobium halophytocola]MBP1852652.1 uncharacterized protein (DUF2235 family) [Rhizobium halophytocola]